MYHFGFIGNVVALLKLNPNRPLIGRVYWYGDHGRQRQKDNDEVIRHFRRHAQTRKSGLREYLTEVLLSGAAGVMSPSCAIAAGDFNTDFFAYSSFVHCRTGREKFRGKIPIKFDKPIFERRPEKGPNMDEAIK